MIFTTDPFIAFMLIVFLAYFIVRKKDQWKVLLIASYLFYWWLAKSAVIFLVISTLSTYLAGILMEKVNLQQAARLEKEKTSLTDKAINAIKKSSSIQKSLIIVAALLINFGILGVLKYGNFAIPILNNFLSHLSPNIKISGLNLLLPLGISFYTFQSCGYVIDVYRAKIPADRHLAKYALFVSFFPQIVQGPISRHSDLAHQLYSSHPFDYNRLKFGLQLVLWGVFKKLVIADRVVMAVDQIFGNYPEYSGAVVFLGAILYSIQIYCDFSGGIDVIRGIAQVMGIDVMENFRRPYFARSIEDFWRRWHISLSAWMRDYVFYPLSFSRVLIRLGKKARNILGKNSGHVLPSLVATTVTFVLVGIWHGPLWKFVAFGFYHSLLLNIGMIAGMVKQRIKISASGQFQKITRWLGGVGTYALVCIGWYFMRADGFKAALRILQHTFSQFLTGSLNSGAALNIGLDDQEIAVLVFSVLVLLLVEINQERGIQVRHKISQMPIALRWGLYLAAIMFVVIFGVYGITFTEKGFIYMGF